MYANRTGANLDDEVATAIKRGAFLANTTLVSVGYVCPLHMRRFAECIYK